MCQMCLHIISKCNQMKMTQIMSNQIKSNKTNYVLENIGIVMENVFCSKLMLKPS